MLSERIIFYDAGSVQEGKYIDAEGNEQTYQWRYLEAMTTDATYEDADSFIFGFHAAAGADASAPDMILTDTTENVKIGSGRYNTTKLVRTCRSEDMDSSNYYTHAAKVCDAFTCGGYDDWFLPSTEEHEAMFKVESLKSQWKANDTGQVPVTVHMTPGSLLRQREQLRLQGKEAPYT